MEIITYEPETVLCREQDPEDGMFIVKKGKLLICRRSNRMVTPLAYLEAGDYFGELSYFDQKPRSADVIAVEKTELIKISSDNLKEQFPTWLLIIARQMTSKIRTMSDVINEKGIRKTNRKTIKPFSIDEQRYIYNLINK